MISAWKFRCFRRLDVRGAAALAVVVLAGAFSMRGQNATIEPAKAMARDADPAFDVATIRPTDPADRSQGFRLSGHRLSIEANNMTALICFAYSVQKSQIVNAPSWFDEQRWNIDGVPDTEGTPNWHQYRLMLQKLLASRFGLKMHPDKRELSVYALVVGKSGSKLTPSKSEPDALSDSSGHGVGSGQYMKFTNLSMPEFAQTMQLMVDRPVVNATNLAGKYDFELLWTPDSLRTTEPNAPPAFFTAVQEQLGLKLEAERTSTDVFVIDHAEKPSEN